MSTPEEEGEWCVVCCEVWIGVNTWEVEVWLTGSGGGVEQLSRLASLCRASAVSCRPKGGRKRDKSKK